MANTSFFTADPESCYQADGNATWTWAYGDRDAFWDFSVRPYQANQRVTLNWVSSFTDNDLNQSTILNITVEPAPAGPNVRPDTSGTLLRFTAVKVEG